MSSTARLVQRIREEYVALPGLKLTREQVCRLWGVGHETCAAALDELLAEGFLHETGTGKYVALPHPRGASVAAVTADVFGSTSLRCPHCGKLNVTERSSRSGTGRPSDETFRCEACHRILSSARRTA